MNLGGGQHGHMALIIKEQAFLLLSKNQAAFVYKVAEDWREGTKLYYLTWDSLPLKWDYNARAVDLSMPCYVQNALTKLCVTPPTHAQHSPPAWTKPTYSTKVQYAEPEDNSKPMLPIITKGHAYYRKSSASSSTMPAP